MRLLILFLSSAVGLFALSEEVSTFSADFNQTITDETNQTIVYRGHIDATRPASARWDYIEPVIKQVFVNHRTATVVEPELEQVIIKTIDKDVDLFKILADAEPVTATTFVARYHDQQFFLRMKGEIPVEITYKDTFENKICLQFSHQKINHPLDAVLFEPHVPSYFDVLTE